LRKDCQPQQAALWSGFAKWVYYKKVASITNAVHAFSSLDRQRHQLIRILLSDFSPKAPDDEE
jgi:hypothetical protein